MPSFFPIILFYSLSNRHAFSFPIAKIGQKLTSIVDMIRRDALLFVAVVFFLFFLFSCNYCSLFTAISLSLLIADTSFTSICSALLASRNWQKGNNRSISLGKKSFNINMGSDTSKSKKRATQLTEEEIQLLLKNTHFNRQQIMEWHQGFLVSSYFRYSFIWIILFEIDTYSLVYFYCNLFHILEYVRKTCW